MALQATGPITGGNGSSQAAQTGPTIAPSELAPGSSRDEVDLINCWRILRKRQVLVLQCWIGAMLLALTTSAVLPKYYESTAAILPQTDTKDSSTLGTLLAASGAAATAQNLGIMLPGMPTTPTDVFVGILKSREMTDAVIRQFHLMEQYGVDTMVRARKKLGRRTKITVTKEKVIQVKVEAADPLMAADMANFYIAHLDRLNRVVTVSKAGQNRQFLERRLSETQLSLANAEEALKEFQTRNKTVAVDAQSKAMIEAGAQLQAQIAAQEVQLQIMGQYLWPDNPELGRVKSGLSELKRQLALLESGKDGKGMLPGHRLHPAMITVPGLALEYGRLMRELKVQETLYTLLISQHEQAKLAEARDTPTVQILDRAVPADEHSRPKILLNVLIAGLLGLTIGVLAALFRDNVERLRTLRPSDPTLLPT
jgi:tyrosine-protein kinase Etk/Wzc